ncbi:MAG: hypothetical protein DMG13_24075 [Acidobacteria bacterium]|nr:MAG: hypothetical protein DMG13_24075 [Acidobacteriota bacterium]
MRLPDANFLEANLLVGVIAMARNSRPDDLASIQTARRNNKVDQGLTICPSSGFPSAKRINH